jgi:hypothetical protein
MTRLETPQPSWEKHKSQRRMVAKENETMLDKVEPELDFENKITPRIGRMSEVERSAARNCAGLMVTARGKRESGRNKRLLGCSIAVGYSMISQALRNARTRIKRRG